MDEESNLEAYVAEERTLRDHLTDQLVLAFADPAQRLIGHHLIDMTDEAGYLRGDLAGVAELLGAPLALVEQTLEVMQGFEPCGVFARDLRECLMLQLKEQDRCDPAMAALIDNLNLLAVHDLAALKRVARVSDEDLMDMIQEVRRLDPKPGLKYGSAPSQPIVPDVLVRALPDGSFHVELNSDTLPRVLVNQSYYATVCKSATKKEDKSYLVDCLQTANWLVKSLDQRARTILKVAQEIVRQQDAFLTYGVRHLRPLNLKTVADAISMHELTVSRVTANKYMATNRGLFELKYFFTSSIAATADGDAHSSEAVRDRIRTMIEAEPASDVLSDDKIVEKLKTDGVDIARRTVAKYREALQIPSSVQRRRLKRIAPPSPRPEVGAVASAGFLCLVASLAISAYGIGASLYGARSGRREFVDSGRRAVYALAGMLVVAIADPPARVRALGLRVRARRQPLVDDDAAVLQARPRCGPRRRARCCCGCSCCRCGAARSCS